eukprot:5754576-Lingulodinium_polyedra.AAC.1
MPCSGSACGAGPGSPGLDEAGRPDRGARQFRAEGARAHLAIGLGRQPVCAIRARLLFAEGQLERARSPNL